MSPIKKGKKSPETEKVKVNKCLAGKERKGKETLGNGIDLIEYRDLL